jgi:hypothetical protein
MKMNKAVCIVALALLVGAGSVTRAEAIPVVSLSGIPAIWIIGDSFKVDVVVTGLDEATGGVNIDLTFDDTTLTGTGYGFGAIAFNTPVDLVNGLDLSTGFAGTTVNLNWTSFELQAVLTAAQGPFPSGPVTLATVNFDATASGANGFGFQTVDLSNNDGTALLPVCIAGQPCPVPEPGTLALFGAALAAFGVRRLRRS